MADGVTTVLGLVKPEVGASSDTWGGKNNANFDVIDALFTDPAKKLLTVAHGGTGVDSIAALKTALSLGTLAFLSTVGTAQIVDGSVTAAKLASGVTLASGTRALFQQTTAPVGWVKETVHNDKVLRIVSGSVVNGGTQPFSNVFASQPITGTVGSATATGTVGGTAITIAQMPLHGHPWRAQYSSQGSYSSDTTGGMPTGAASASSQGPFTGPASSSQGQQIGGEGGGATHTHTFTGSPHTHTIAGASLDLAVQYIDVIIAVKS